MIEFFPTPRAIVRFGSLTLYWYGVLYVVAFAVAGWLWPYVQGYRGLRLTRGQVVELVTWVAAGVVVGGRLGYVFLYAPLYYLANPEEIFLLSRGGMSSHGGFIGVAVAVWIVSKWVLSRHALLRSNELRKGEAPPLPREARQGEVGARHPFMVGSSRKSLGSSLPAAPKK